MVIIARTDTLRLELVVLLQIGWEVVDVAGGLEQEKKGGEQG